MEPQNPRFLLNLQELHERTAGSDVAVTVRFPYELETFCKKMFKKMEDKTILCSHEDMLSKLHERYQELNESNQLQLYLISIRAMAKFISKSTLRYRITQGGVRTCHVQYGNALLLASFDKVTTFIHEVTHEFDEKLAWKRMRAFLLSLPHLLPNPGKLKEYIRLVYKKRKANLEAFFGKVHREFDEVLFAKMKRKLRDFEDLEILKTQISHINDPTQPLTEERRRKIERTLNQALTHIIKKGENLSLEMSVTKSNQFIADTNKLLLELETLFIQAIQLGLPIQKFYYQFQSIQYESRYNLYTDKEFKELIIQSLDPAGNTERWVDKTLSRLASLFEFTIAEYSGIKVIDEVVARIQEHLIDKKLYKLMLRLEKEPKRVVGIVHCIVKGHVKRMKEEKVEENDNEKSRKSFFTLLGPWKILEDALSNMMSNLPKQ